jgi:tetratricopeptide (TPR) repeat protein
MENPSLQRALLLIEQKNFDRAEKELNVALSDTPDNEDALVLLALCKYNIGEYQKGLDIVNRAISINPNNHFSIYILALCYFALNKRDTARLKIEEAIRLNPFSAVYFAFLAKIHLYNNDFKDALKYADEGLRIDSENISALNVRSAALGKLGDKEGAYKTIDTALQQDPNNAFTHANHGHILLEKREYDKALFHFKEALKSDPNSQYAKAGLIEGLKAKSIVYSWFLQYSFWIGNLKGNLQWAFIIGFYILFRVINSVAESNPSIAPFLTPILVIMILLAFSSWFISPLHDLFLFLNPFGKYALSDREKNVARLVGGFLGVGLISLLLFAIFRNDTLLGIAGFSLIMLIPIGSMYNGNNAKSDRILAIYTLVAALIGISGLSISLTSGNLFNPMTTVFIGVVFIYQWIANIIIAKTR